MKTVFEARIFPRIIFIRGFCYLLISYKFHGCPNRQGFLAILRQRESIPNARGGRKQIELVKMGRGNRV